MEKRNEIMEVSFELAIEIIKYAETLEGNRKYIIENNYYDQELQWEQTFERHRVPKAELILYIN